MLKFRTMHSNNNAAVHQEYVTWFIKSSAEAKQSGQTKVFKIANDPRVTPIGRFLRRTSLDELPQLWNVAARRDVAGRSAAAAAVRSRAV